MIVGKSMVLGILLGAIVALVVVYVSQQAERFVNPIREETSQVNFEEYSIPALRKRNIAIQKIEIDEVVEKSLDVRSYMFHFYDDGKKVSGLLNAPKLPGVYPVVVMLRGYVDKEIYLPGIGTQRAAEFFAKNGFITLAPDFLGYGFSDEAATDSLESRFQTYTTTLALFGALDNLDESLKKIDKGLKIQEGKVAIWAHSNGGQIAISYLAIKGNTYPTTLWAPVTHPFPESILYFADEMPDGGAYLRQIVGDFMQRHNPRLYSPPQYASWIKAPILLHQGTADDAVPFQWSNTFADKMEYLNKDIVYHIYPDEDHNFAQGSWTTLVNRDLQFFRTKLNL